MRALSNTIKGLGTFLLFILFSACAGSGSSGFDAQLSSEQVAIAKVGEEGGCEVATESVICAPGATPDTSSPAAGSNSISDQPVSTSEGLGSTATLSINPTSNESVACQEGASLLSGTCTFNIQVTLENFQDQTQFFVLTRQGPSATWSLRVEADGASSDLNSLVFEAMIALNETLETGSEELQIALLVYLPDTTVPEENIAHSLLFDYGADIIYVVSGLDT